MNILRHNLGYKLLALVLSVGLWAKVHLEQGEGQHAFDDSVEVRNVSDGLIPNLNLDHVRVIVTGQAGRMENLSADDVRTWVDLSGFKVGRSRAPVRCEVGQEADLFTCSAQPSVLAVEMEARIERNLPIKVLVTGTPPLGYAYARPQATPPNAAVSGRKGDVAKVKQLVASVTTNGESIGQGVDQNARVLPLDGNGSPIPHVEVDPSEVRIVAPLRLEPASKRLIVNPIPIGRTAEGYKVTAMVASPKEILAKGEASALANLTGVHTRPLDLSGLSSDRTLRAALESIEGIDFEPENVSVRIEIQPVQGPPSRTPPPSPGTPASPPAVRTPSTPIPGGRP